MVTHRQLPKKVYPGVLGRGHSCQRDNRDRGNALNRSPLVRVTPTGIPPQANPVRVDQYGPNRGDDSMWYDELPPGKSWAALWSDYILCENCFAIGPHADGCSGTE